MQCKLKVTVQHTQFFPRFQQVTGNFYEFWLVRHAVNSCCDWVWVITLISVFRTSTKNRNQRKRKRKLRKATGSEVFFYLTCLHIKIIILLSIFTLVETVSLKFRKRPLSWHAECAFPVLDRGSKTSLALMKCYKPPNFFKLSLLPWLLWRKRFCFWPWIFPSNVVLFQSKDDNTGEWV